MNRLNTLSRTLDNCLSDYLNIWKAAESLYSVLDSEAPLWDITTIRLRKITDLICGHISRSQRAQKLDHSNDEHKTPMKNLLVSVILRTAKNFSFSKGAQQQGRIIGTLLPIMDWYRDSLTVPQLGWLTYHPRMLSLSQKSVAERWKHPKVRMSSNKFDSIADITILSSSSALELTCDTSDIHEMLAVRFL